jgi:hypothetical protein
MSKHERGPANAGNDGKHVPPKNSSPSFKGGGSVIREALRGTEGRSMHVGGGCQQKGGDPKPRKEEDGRP